MAQSEILLSANNRNQLYVLQYSTGEYKKFIPLFDELEDYLIAAIAKNPESYHTVSGYKELLAKANDKIDELIKTQNLEFVGDYPLLAQQQADFVEMSLNRAVIGYSAALPSLPVLMKEVYRVPMVLGNKPITLDDLSGQITTDTKRNVKRSILMGYTRGQTTQELIQQIRGTKTIKGAIPQSKLDTERVVRTSLNHVATTARQRANKQNRDLVIGYRWLSTLDSRTSAICRARDGEVFLYKNSPNPLPPAHYMCRSTTTQELSSNNPLARKRGESTRASKGAEGGKPVKDNLTYYEWLKTQPASFQDEALGKTQGLIFRNSGLTPEEFKKASVNRFDQPLTIEQMKQKNKEIDDYLSED